jgi:hypothetical protein
MLRGTTPRAEEMAGTAVFRIVVSSDSIKRATATSHGSSRLEAAVGSTGDGSGEDGVAVKWRVELIWRELHEAFPLRTC